MNSMTQQNTSIPEIKTISNLESAFAGESMAHIKYLYFAKISREQGDDATAEAFESTAKQEILHAFGHLDLLYPKESITPSKALQIAIEGETYEYTEMYPGFQKTAKLEGDLSASIEFNAQIEESKTHALQFKETLLKAQKRFSALTDVEKRHAANYKKRLDVLNSNQHLH